MKPPARAASLESAAAVALGALQSLAFTHTTVAWWLPILTLAALAWRLNGATPGRAAWLGWLYGTGWLCAGVWWLYISLHRYGGLPAPLAAGAVFALAAALSLYMAAACGFYARWRRGTPWRDAGLFAALFLLAEMARAVIFTGFPWLAVGYAQVDAPWAAAAPWIGVHGVGALVAWLAAWLAALPSRGRGRPRVVAGAIAVGSLALPAVLGAPDFSVPAGRFNATLLQTNVRQDEKFVAERMPQALAWVADALTGPRTGLVVAPETAVPLLPQQLDELAPGYWDGLRGHFVRSAERAALVGVPLGDFERGYTNSVAGLSTAPGPYRYDKLHLVPFGEFVPTGFRWFTEMMHIPLGDFTRGVLNPPSFHVLGQRLAPNICYEDLFGDELARRFIDPALAPTAFVNVGNIAWFGDTVAVPQHLNISRFRTLELQRPMLRATNTGATAFIDHRGTVTAQLPAFVQGVLEGEVEGRDGVTPFAAWAARFGLWPLTVAAFAAIAVCGAGPRRP